MVPVGSFQLWMGGNFSSLLTFCDVRDVSGVWVSHNPLNLVILEIFQNPMVCKNHSGGAALLILKYFSSTGEGKALGAG